MHHVIGWTDWNMVLDLQGGPSWAKNWQDAPILVDPDKHAYYRQPHFYGMAHYAKFLPPGSVRVDSQQISRNNTNAQIGAFRTPNNSTVVVIVNKDEKDIELTIEDTKIGGKPLKTTTAPKTIETYVYFD